MPRATVSQDTERFELKSLPAAGTEEGGWVELKRLTYGQLLERRDMAAKITARQDPSGKKGEVEQEIKSMQDKVAQFEFKNCIMAHNLTDEDGNILDLTSPLVIRMLDPKVGDEISTLIDSLNQFEVELGN